MVDEHSHTNHYHMLWWINTVTLITTIYYKRLNTVTLITTIYYKWLNTVTLITTIYYGGSIQSH